MSLTTFTASDGSVSPGRRQQRRYELQELTYVDLGPDNGGILLDIDEDGLDFQGILPVSDGQIVSVEFKLPGMSTTIRATGEFVRKENPGRAGGGLRFVNLPEATRQQLREWIAGEVSRQENQPRSGEKESTPDGGHLADPRATSRPADSPAPSRELQSALVSPESRTLPITPIPQESRAVVSSQEQSIAPASPYRTKSATNQKVRRELTTLPPQAKDRTWEPLNLGSQVLQFACGVATGCLEVAAIAGALLWFGYLRLPSVAASRPSARQNATGPSSSEDFRLEIVNLNGQRWMMPMGADNPMQPWVPAAQAQVVPAQNAETAAPHADPAAKVPRNRP